MQRLASPWDTQRYKSVSTTLSGGFTDAVYSVALSADGPKVIIGSGDKTVRVWELTSGECIKPMEGHTDAVYSVALSADGLKVISGSADKTVRVWDLTSGECIKAMEGHTSCLYIVALSADGLKAISVFSRKCVYITPPYRYDQLRLE